MLPQHGASQEGEQIAAICRQPFANRLPTSLRLASLVGEENETANLREQRRQFATCDFLGNSSPLLLISTTLVVGRAGKVTAMKVMARPPLVMIVRWAIDATRIAEKTAGPPLDVFIRLWLAGIFWASGMAKLQSWSTALDVTAHECRVSSLDPVAAAWLGGAVEIVCPPLLVLGLATRFAALPLLVFSLAFQGRYVASVIRASIDGRPRPAPFRYRHAGSLATIGRKAAVADFGRLQLSGALAWWVWGVVHILFLSGMRNRLVVALEWFWAYLTYRPSTRLITDEIPIPTRGVLAPSTEKSMLRAVVTT